MTKKELVKIIQEAVRREVKKEVKKIFIKENSSPKLEDIVSKISTSEEKIFMKLREWNIILKINHQISVITYCPI